MEAVDESLTLDRLCSLDRPSVYVAGMVVAKAIEKTKVVVLMVDVLGRVVLMPPSSVQVLNYPKVQDSDLDALDEDEAIALMVKEGRGDDEVLSYLKRRLTDVG